jgi:transposase
MDQVILEKLPDDTDSLKEIIIDLHERQRNIEEELNKKNQANLILEEQIKLLKHKLYGKSSEKSGSADKDQLGLFNEAETIADESGDDKITEEQITYVKGHKRKKRGRVSLPANLPREEVIHDLSDEEKRCKCCNKERPCIGSESSEELHIEAPKFKVIKHVKLKYGACNCKASQLREEPEIKTAKMPARLLPGSIASPGLLSFIIVSKFADALPFYRLEKILKRYGVDIPRMTMCNWAIKTASLCQELLEIMDKEIRSGPLIQMDETTLQVIAEPGRSAASKSYMWVRIGYRDGKQIILFNYHQSRSKEIPLSLLNNYKGYLQTDGYSGYDDTGELPDIIHVGCFGHSRRKFNDANKASRNKGSSQAALSYINELYKIEKELRGKLDGGKISIGEFTAERKKLALPVLVKFKDWLDKKVKQAPPETLIGKAINYTLGQWDKMIRYTDMWFLTPDNNRAENAIRPFVIGRKNWLFSYTPRGAHASAALYSIIETAKANGIEPYHYLKYLFTKLPQVKNQDELENLLPTRLQPSQLLQQ